MTKPKRAFAEMLVAAQGSGDVDEICGRMSMMDIIYELKRLEKEPEPAPPEPEPAPPPPKERESDPVAEAIQRVFRPNFWSRLVGEDENDV
jgi:hypothetical protein